jgi:anthranilate phosphoribosyltransferase
MIGDAIQKLMNREEITFEMTKKVMDEIMTGEATEVQIASFLTALKMQGETVENITACAEAMREHCTSFNPETDVIDIVGTGGDGAFTFNISTVSSFVVAAANIPVAKHGNRSVSSKCGAADVLEELGVTLHLTPEQNKEVLKKCGMCFMFAPSYHASMKYAAPVRKELGVRTIFNILGPLANPAGARLQLLGVYHENLVLPMAKVLSNLGVKRAVVVHGKDGLDEVTVCDDTVVCEVEDGKFKSYLINPNDFGIEKCGSEQLAGGDKRVNAQIAKDILNGQLGPKRDIVLMNAGISIYLGKDGVDINTAIKIAAETLDSGKAKQKMEQFITLTNMY